MSDRRLLVQQVWTDYENESWMVWSPTGETITQKAARAAVHCIIDGGCHADMVTFPDGKLYRVAPSPR